MFFANPASLDFAPRMDITRCSSELLTCLDVRLTGCSDRVRFRYRAGEQMSNLGKSARQGTIARVNALEEAREYLPGELAKAVGVARSSVGSYLSNEAVFPPASVNNTGRKYSKGTARALVVFNALLKPPFGFKRSDAYTVLARMDLDKCWNFLEKSNKDLLLHIVGSGLIDDIINREQ